MRELVFTVGAFALPGASVDYQLFVPILWRAVSRGFVSPLHAHFVQRGLRWGFDLGFSPDKLPVRRFFKNYPSALSAKAAISKNIFGRLESGKSASLFPLCPASVRSSLSSFLPSWCVFPLGAVPKGSDPGDFRPISDHTRTGFNDASTDEHLRHSLDSIHSIGKLLRDSYHMAVHDVDAAFPLLPLSPLLWPFFIFAWPAPSPSGSALQEEEWWLHWHLCGDFGARGLPGTFKIFFVDVLVGMARSEGALTLPLVVHVDDCSLIGEHPSQVDEEASNLECFLALLGVFFKLSKHRPASQRQYVVGLWWDSVSRSRSLDESKVDEYVYMLSDFAARSSLSLREIQMVCGRLQRACLTFPPGAACLMSNLFSLMRGLTSPGARRRVSSSVGADLSCAARLLRRNLGKGFFSFDRFRRAAPLFTDASKSSRYVGGGFFSHCGRFSFWRYGSSSSRKPIDELEGDTVVKAVRALGHLWRHSVVPIFIDNQAFQASARKGWSKAPRLASLVRLLFFLAVDFGCIFEFRWISTHDNVFADALSRPDPLAAFEGLVASSLSSLPSGLLLQRLSDLPEVRGLDPLTFEGSLGTPLPGPPGRTKNPGQVTSVNSGPAFSSDIAGDGHPWKRRRADIYDEGAYGTANDHNETESSEEGSDSGVPHHDPPLHTLC